MASGVPCKEALPTIADALVWPRLNQSAPYRHFDNGQTQLLDRYPPDKPLSYRLPADQLPMNAVASVELKDADRHSTAAHRLMKRAGRILFHNVTQILVLHYWWHVQGVEALTLRSPLVVISTWTWTLPAATCNTYGLSILLAAGCWCNFQLQPNNNNGWHLWCLGHVSVRQCPASVVLHICTAGISFCTQLLRDRWVVNLKEVLKCNNLMQLYHSLLRHEIWWCVSFQ